MQMHLWYCLAIGNQVSKDNQFFSESVAYKCLSVLRIQVLGLSSIDAVPTIQVKKIEIEWSVRETDIRN